MRIMIKGGVWKNTEDEILKAAVMKYGKNQWARISSLLVRKSAKQCKARWFEWLDPSIKKTEWTRDEEEKLLHLAKIMPTQWRTIAPIVGRTPAQCLERYERLLDAAQGSGAVGPGGKAEAGSSSAAADPRRLRPGEIDPNPESKPARPDAVDMDEDEKEMLSEARARLANTKGKKAKRKAREKQLEEARRLAQLQKRREMRAAGIAWRKGGRKRKRKWGVDYNAEIPFYKKAPKGFFDTSAEKASGFQAKRPTSFLGKTVDQINGERRDVKEERERKKDARRQRLHRKKNLPEHILRISKLNDVPGQAARPEMVLPSPQLTDAELEQVSALGEAGALLRSSGNGSAGPTATLVADYAATPATAASGRTPAIRTPAIRTPAIRTPMARDTIMQEAQTIIKLRNTQTPLLGGENPEISTNFGGVTPGQSRMVTPNPLATPAAASTAQTPGGTPSTTAGFTPTPSRDNLGINAPQGGLSAAAAVAADRRRRQARKRRLQSAFGALPRAVNHYATVVPELPADPAEAARAQGQPEEDAEDMAAVRAERERRRADEAMRRRSQVLQRGLPRPVAIGNVRFASDARKSSPEQRLIAAEMDALVRFDEATQPIAATARKGKTSSKRKAAARTQDANFDLVSAEEMARARALLDAELRRVTPAGSTEAAMDVWADVHEDVMFLPTQKRFSRLSTASKSDKIAALRQEFMLTQQHLARETRRADKASKRLNVTLGGYQMRAQRLVEKIGKATDESDGQARDARCFAELSTQEEQALPLRVKAIQECVEREAEKEAALQARYARLVKEKEQLMVAGVAK